MGMFETASRMEIDRTVEAASGDMVGEVEPVFLTRRADARDLVKMNKTMVGEVMRVTYRILEPSIDDADVARLFLVAYLDVFAGNYYRSKASKLVLENEESGQRRESPYPDPE